VWETQAGLKTTPNWGIGSINERIRRLPVRFIHFFVILLYEEVFKNGTARIAFVGANAKGDAGNKTPDRSL
jgi:hypothetical protein